MFQRLLMQRRERPPLNNLALHEDVSTHALGGKDNRRRDVRTLD
jgi:hypothetical protein